MSAARNRTGRGPTCDMTSPAQNIQLKARWVSITSPARKVLLDAIIRDTFTRYRLSNCFMKLSMVKLHRPQCCIFNADYYKARNRLILALPLFELVIRSRRNNVEIFEPSKCHHDRNLSNWQWQASSVNMERVISVIRVEYNMFDTKKCDIEMDAKWNRISKCNYEEVLSRAMVRRCR